MAVRIRLRRMGAKKRPFYRVVVADSRSPRDGRFLDTIGTYDPVSDPAKIELDRGKALKWLSEGAEPTDSARSILSQVGVWAEHRTGVAPDPAETRVARAAAPLTSRPEIKSPPPKREPKVEPVEDEPTEGEPAPTRSPDVGEGAEAAAVREPDTGTGAGGDR